MASLLSKASRLTDTPSGEALEAATMAKRVAEVFMIEDYSVAYQADERGKARIMVLRKNVVVAEA